MDERRSSSRAERRLFIVLPVYDEAQNLRPLFDEFRVTEVLTRSLGYRHRYIAVDDASRDGSRTILAELAADFDLESLENDRNRGLGFTLDRGLRYATEQSRSGDIIVTLDADNTQPALLLHKMVIAVLERHHVVIASRYRYGADVVGLEAYRRILSHGAGLLFRALYPIRGVRDYTSGFRAYDSAVLREAYAQYGDAFIEQSGFQCMAEILLKIDALGRRVVFSEVPMVLRYDYKGGSSKMNVLRTVRDTARMLVTYKARVRRIRRAHRPHDARERTDSHVADDVLNDEG